MSGPLAEERWARREVVDGMTILISTDQDLLDVAYVHQVLSGQYWCQGIPRRVVEQALANSLCFGLYHIASAAATESRDQVGLARVVTDRATFAYLCDVFVDDRVRGRGLGKRLMQAVMAHPHLQGLRRFMLLTRDAHGLYQQFGFTAAAAPDRIMEKWDPQVYQRPMPG